MERQKTLDSFGDALRDLGVPQNRIAGVMLKVTTHYNEVHRHYHNWSHIESMMDTAWGVIPGGLRNPHAIVALVLHDVIYEPARNDNEDNSAAFATEALEGCREADIEKVCAIIMATKGHQASSSVHMSYVLDLDLSILGSEYETCMEYDDKIRREYAFVPNEVFNVHRAAFLNKMLDQPQIYFTEVFRRMFEERARENMRRLLTERYGGGKEAD